MEAPTDERARQFAQAVAAANRANDALLGGDAEPLRACFSHAEDVSLFGGFGGHEVGWSRIGPRLEWVARGFAGGTCAYEPLASWLGGDVGVVVQFERIEARLRDRAEPQRLALRVTMVFRREGDRFRLVHRHGDHLVEKEDPARAASRG
jgi:ketosteroid isomerase-like protein